MNHVLEVLILYSFPSNNTFSNANTQSITLTQQTNGLLTDGTNGYNRNFTKSQQHFYDRAESICKIEQRLFCCDDFNLSMSNFRHKILELKPYIVKVVSGRPSFYKIKGVDMPDDLRSITLRPTGVDTTQLEKILLNCKNQPPCIHDLRFKIYSNLHEKLLQKGLTPNKHNNSILITNDLIPSPDPTLNIKLLVYPKHVQLIVGCSTKPIIYNHSSMQDLGFNLGRYTELLRSFVNDLFSITPVSKWIVTAYHLNKDGSFELQDSNFNYYFEDVANCLTRIYSKHFPDGKIKPRLERTLTMNKPFEELAREAMN